MESLFSLQARKNSESGGNEPLGGTEEPRAVIETVTVSSSRSPLFRIKRLTPIVRVYGSMGSCNDMLSRKLL